MDLENPDHLLALRIPDYATEHSLWAGAYHAGMLDCVRRARVDLDPSVAIKDITLLQLPLTFMVESEILFLWYVIEEVHQRYRIPSLLY